MGDKEQNEHLEVRIHTAMQLMLEVSACDALSLLAGEPSYDMVTGLCAVIDARCDGFRTWRPSRATPSRLAPALPCSPRPTCIITDYSFIAVGASGGQWREASGGQRRPVEASGGQWRSVEASGGQRRPVEASGDQYQ